MAGKRRMGFKPSLREQRLASNAAQSFYASMLPLDDPRRAENERRLKAERDAIAPKRERKPSGKPLEAPVIAAISELLSRHPHVLLAVRQNSGMASYEAKSGKFAPVYFYKLLGPNAQYTTLTDFWGFMRDGRLLAIEAKPPGFTNPRDDRERKQANFLALVRNCGGRAGFATSVDEAQRIIEGE